MESESKKINTENDVESFYKKYSGFLIVIIIILGLVLFYISNQPEKVEIVEKIAVLETNYGTIKIELYLDESPITAGNFKKLVEEGYYDGVKFHRVIPNFMIQGGDPMSKQDSMVDSWGTGGPGYSIEDEYIEGLSNVRGTIAMANSGPNTGGSQFFINTVDNIQLDWNVNTYKGQDWSTSRHPVFGKVILGMDIVDEISNVQTTKPYNRPIDPVIIEKAYME